MAPSDTARTWLEIEVVEVGVEPLIDPPLRVEHIRTNESASAIAARLEDFRQRDLIRAEEEPAVVADAVLRRELAGEDARVRRQRQRRDRDRLFEQHAFRAPADRWSGVSTSCAP